MRPSGPHGKHLSWGLAPSSRSSNAESTCGNRSHAIPAFRPQVFSTSRRLTPRLCPAALFHAADTYRVLPTPSRGFPSRAAVMPRRHPIPSCRFILGAQPRGEPSGLLPRSAAPGLCSTRESVTLVRLLHLPRARSPHGLSPLPGLRSSCRRAAFTAPPLMPLGLATPSEEESVSTELQRITEQEARLASFESCRPA
jgi:hypothetical protein